MESNIPGTFLIFFLEKYKTKKSLCIENQIYDKKF